MSTPQEPGPDFERHQYSGELQPTQEETPPTEPASVPLGTPPSAWYTQKRFFVPLAAVALVGILGVGGALGRTTARPEASPPTPTAAAPSSSAVTFTLAQSCTYVTSTIEGVIDFGYDDDADSTTAGGLATRLRQNVAPSPPPIHDDIALLITNLDKIQTSTMKVADFTEPSERILTACDVDYTSPNDPLADLEDEPTDEPTEDPTEEPAPQQEESKFDKLSDEQQDAYGSAQDYLESSGFSKAGLIDQLSSEYGSDYDRDDAKKAVDALDEDWNKQAVRVAKSYRETSHFSTNGLIEQLESDYGNQFTHSQAVYGAKHSR